MGTASSWMICPTCPICAFCEYRTGDPFRRRQRVLRRDERDSSLTNNPRRGLNDTFTDVFWAPTLSRPTRAARRRDFPQGERYMGSLPIEHWLIIIVVVVAIAFTIYRALRGKG